MLRLSGLLFLGMLSWQSWAGNFDFLPAAAGPEKEFQSLMNAGNYRQALMTWTSAHSGSAFGTSQSGTATYAYLLYQNGMPYTGLELLVQNTQPARLDPQLLKLWTAEVKASHFIQHGWIATTGGWKTVVNNEPAVFTIKNKKDINAAFARAERFPKDQPNAKARIWWQIAAQAPQIDDVDSALKALKLLKESGQGVIGQDMVQSAYARVLYQKGDMEAALLSFHQIPKGSALWVESVEERAWAYLRKGDNDKALGEVTTILSPALSPLVGPESYFLANLMSLRICDYPRIFRNSENFKKRHRDRLVEIQALASTGTNKAINGIFERFEKNGVSIEAAGPQVAFIPRSAFRDAKFVRWAETRRQLLSEVAKAAELKDAASALGGAAELERFAMAARTQSERAKQQAFQRVRTLAAGEVKEYRMILNKMHIIEGEVIERLHLDDSLKGERNKLAKQEAEKGDVLEFPYNTDEVWLDELDNYKARVKDCPQLKSVKGASL